MERLQGRTLRRRIAAILWIPGGFAAAAIGSGLDSWVAGVLTFALLVAALWLFAERGNRVRRRLPTSDNEDGESPG